MDRMTFIRTSAAAVGATILAGNSKPAQAQTPQPTGSRFDLVHERGKLIVSTMTTIPPFAFKADSGELQGFDIDIARIAAKAMFNDSGKIEFLGVSGDGRWPSILTGQGDFGFATTYMSRAIFVAFTEPYLDTSITLLASKSGGLKSLADVNKSNITVANLSNPQMADRAKQFFPEAKVIVFDGISDQFLALRSGRAQAMQIDTPVADYFAALNKNEVQVLDARLGDIFGNGIYLQAGDLKWWQWLNTFVRELKFGTLYTEYSRAYNIWYGKNPPPQRFYTV